MLKKEIGQDIPDQPVIEVLDTIGVNRGCSFKISWDNAPEYECSDAGTMLDCSY